MQSSKACYGNALLDNSICSTGKASRWAPLGLTKLEISRRYSFATSSFDLAVSDYCHFRITVNKPMECRFLRKMLQLCDDVDSEGSSFDFHEEFSEKVVKFRAEFSQGGSAVLCFRNIAVLTLFWIHVSENGECVRADFVEYFILNSFLPTLSSAKGESCPLLFKGVEDDGKNRWIDMNQFQIEFSSVFRAIDYRVKLETTSCGSLLWCLLSLCMFVIHCDKWHSILEVEGNFERQAEVCKDNRELSRTDVSERNV
nr:hypothetical protein Iba_chr15dCG5350 [Ipomoea batatas]